MGGARVVVFDIGGVLVEICHTWHAAARTAAIDHQLATDAPFTDFAAFNDYQAGQIDLDAYCQALGRHLSIDADAAQAVHDAILVRDYPGSRALVDDLHAAGVATACLSNTNGRHWDVLLDPRRHPSVAALRTPLASHLLGFNKPDRRIYEAAAERLGQPAEIVFFDDSAANVQGARDAGWNAFQVDPDNDPTGRMRRVLAEVGILLDPEPAVGQG